MTNTTYTVALTATTLGGAAVGGLFYAYSTFTMRGLDRATASEAIAAMRGINAEAQGNAPLLLLLFGSTVLALTVGVIAAARIGRSGNVFVVAGAVLVVLAAVVTVAFNVPLNDGLAALDVTTLSPVQAATHWQDYLTAWTASNHVRTAAPLLGSVLLAVGLLRGR